MSSSKINIDRILSIPLSYFAGHDRLVWHHSPNGIYSVKSVRGSGLALSLGPVPTSRSGAKVEVRSSGFGAKIQGQVRCSSSEPKVQVRGWIQL
ncbi:hypothetical protein F8388_003889 [Cannabis sativa]|uniref:Uncharacterized protein n=1 Tax=Cannabis sativa TaxID=3483 RepID=A0A7J6GNV0_CANSA|nr:hypothetical protein F8388_003889 [Cannabis sativa]